MKTKKKPQPQPEAAASLVAALAEIRDSDTVLAYPVAAGDVAQEHCELVLGDLELDAGGKAPKGRRFTMLANSGRPILGHWWFGNLGIDLGGIKTTQPRLPVLLDHDPEKRVGFTEQLRVESRGLVAEGQMLTESSDDAKAIVAQSKDGFPWQASVRLQARRVQLLDEGEEAEVNGYRIEGPGAIFRESELREVTFTALGADSSASAATLTAAKGAAVATAQFERVHMKKTEMQGAAADGEVQAAAAVPDPMQIKAAAEQAAKDAVAAERARQKAIRDAADPQQAELVQKLIDSEVSLAEALPQLNADLRKRLEAAAAAAKVPAQPAGAGNREPGAALEATDPEQLKAQFHAVGAGALRREFLGSEQVFLAFHRNKHRTASLRSLADLNSDKEVQLGAASAVGYRGIKGSYWLAFESGEQGSWVNRIATRTTSDQLDELFKWLSNPPLMTEWTGMRQREQLRDYGIRLVNKKYTATIEADVDDLRRDGFGMIPRRVAEMGAVTAMLPERLISSLLEANPTAYDGIALFATNHAVGGNTIDNLDTSSATSPDAPTAAEMSTAIIAAVTKLQTYLDDRGNPMNGNARRFVCMVPPKYAAAAVAAISNTYLAAGTSNTLEALMRRGYSIDLVVNPLLTGTAAAAGRRFYTWREDGGVAPIIWQEENIPDGFRSVDGASEGSFWTDMAAYGTKRICVPGPGRFEYIHRTELQ